MTRKYLHEYEQLDAERLRPAETPRYEKGMFHITAHAVDDMYAFCDWTDRQEFLDCFKRHLSPTPVRDPQRRRPFPSYLGQVSLVAFCILENHYHLILRQHSSMGVRRLMRSVCVSYGRYFNGRYRRWPGSPIWAGEYTATKINGSRQGAAAMTYVTLNHEVDRERYSFCSHDYYTGDRSADWIDLRSGLWFFGGSVAEYERAIREEGTAALERKIARRAAKPSAPGRTPARGRGSHIARD